MPTARHPRTPNRAAGHGAHVTGATTMFGSNLGPAHIHAVARRVHLLDEARRSRHARLATAGRGSAVSGLRQSMGRAIVSLGLWLHGNVPPERRPCPACEARLA